MTNTTDRIIYVHKESKMYLTHTHYVELMTCGRESGIFPELVINVPQHITLIEFPINVNTMDRPKVDRYTYLIEKIPYDPDWEVEIISEFTERELCNLSSAYRCYSDEDRDVVYKINNEFSKTQKRKYEGYREINIMD